MSIFKHKVLGIRGDTIIEVLVSIVIVSSVLAGAFSSSRRSTNATQAAQERGEALKLAEQQAEQIKVAYVSSRVLPPGPTDFCFDTAGVVRLDPPCTTSGIVYNSNINRPAAGDDYVITVTWDSQTGDTNKVELDYRAQ